MGRRAAVLLVGLVLLAPACGGDDASTSTTRPRPSPQVEAAPGLRTEERTVARLRTLVVRPTGAGPFPLVIFIHGAGAPPEYYEDLLEDLAAAGNVVVAPAMPGSVDHSDLAAVAALPSQPRRVRQVLDAVTEGRDAIDAIDPERIVVMGHSLGGMTALAVGFHSCCSDRRVDAIVSVAGELAPFPEGRFGVGTIPLLLIHGESDDVVPFGASGEALERVGAPAYLLAVDRGDHGSYLGREDGAHTAVVAAIVAFLEATVGGDPGEGLADLADAGSRPGVRLTTRN
jgi:dienelactone hydrolase